MKFIKLLIDERELVERGTVQVRRGPGHCRYNFGQKIPLLPKHCPAQSKELPNLNPKQHLSEYIYLGYNFVIVEVVLKLKFNDFMRIS